MTTATHSTLVRVMASLVVLYTATSAFAQNPPLTGTDGAKPSIPATIGAKTNVRKATEDQIHGH